MQIIGVTGGIGSGKTTVCKIFEQLSVPVFYSDAAAQQLLGEDRIVNEIVAVFGKNVLDSKKNIDKQWLSSVVFSDKNLLEKLNNIIHPRVADLFKHWQHAQKNKKIVLKETALLFENNLSNQVNRIITVVSPIELRVRRVMSRNGISEEEVMMRINNQMTDEDKIKRSDYVIENDEKKMILPQVLDVYKKISA